MKGHLSLKAWNNLRYQAVLLIRADVAFCSFAPIRPYNNILRRRTDAYCDRQEKLGYTQADKRLTAMPEYSWPDNVSAVPLRQAIRHQQTAFDSFFA